MRYNRAMRNLRLAVPLLILFVPAVAAADIAPPSPSDLRCPRGSMGRVHRVEGERGFSTSCEPTSCEADTDCEGGLVCSTDTIGLCVEQVASATGEQVPSARDRGCEPDGTCLNVNSTCERARRCVDAGQRGPAESAEAEPAAERPTVDEDDGPPEELSGGDGGCGCRAAPGSPVGPIAAAIGLLGLVALRRRR